MPYVTHTIIDYSGERSNTRHYLPAITAANYAAITGNTAVQNVGALRIALGAITDGNFVKHEVTVQEASLPNTLPADENAQRETKLLIRYVSSANRRGSLEVPGANRSILSQPNTDEVDETATAWINLVSELQLNCRDSYGDSITVTGGRLVGRRL